MSGRLLLTGADGFTGRHLASAALEAGFDVYGLRADLTRAEAVLEEIGGQHFDFVVHLAAISAVTHTDEAALYAVNLFGSLNLISALHHLQHAPQKIIVASSANVYGNSPLSPIDESAPTAPTNHYAMSKLAMEHMVAAASEALPVVVARPFNYTGIGHDERFVVPKLVRHFRERRATVQLGNIGVEREFNDVRDICLMYLRLLDKGNAGETYNLCTGSSYSLTHIINALQDLTGHEIAPRVNPKFVRDNEVHTLCGDPSKLLDCLGPLPRHALEDTLQWMMEGG